MQKPIICFFKIFLPAIFSVILTGAGPPSLVYEGPVFQNGAEASKPPESMEQDGAMYRLRSLSMEPGEREGETRYGQVEIPYSLEGTQEAPESAVVRIWDPASEVYFEREFPKTHETETGEFWDEGFSFPVTVTGYDADYYYLGETQVESVEKLSDYGELLLMSLGLSEDQYQVTDVSWDGEPYEENGILCRRALARGKKKIRTVMITYGGTVKMPDIEGSRYIGIYEAASESAEASVNPAEEGGETEEITSEQTKERPIAEIQTKRQTPEAAGTLPDDSEAGILQWIYRHMTIIRISLLAVAAVLMVFLLLRASGKQRKKESPEKDHTLKDPNSKNTGSGD